MLRASVKVNTNSANLVDDYLPYLIIVGNWALESLFLLFTIMIL